MTRYPIRVTTRAATVVFIVLAIAGTLWSAPAPPPGGCLPWHDASTWPDLGRIPTSTDQDVLVAAGRVICLTGTAVVGSLNIQGTLDIRGGGDLRVGNVVVQGASGALVMGPRSTITLLAPVGTSYAGRGNAVIPGDVGIWVVRGGRLDLRGSPKTPWTRLAGSVTAGASSIQVQAAVNWQAGDRISITPTAHPSATPNSSAFADQYDERTVAAVNSTTIRLDRPLSFNHPAVTVRPGVTYAAEVLNLTRDVTIQGADEQHRAHIWIMNDTAVPHVVSYAAIRYMGPQQCFRGPCEVKGQNNLVENLGRYPLHFHMNGNYSAGSRIDGAVITEFGAHAIVYHDSNGITTTNTIAHRGYGDAYWWDNVGSGCTNPRCAEPSGLIFQGNVASRVAFIPEFRGFILTGFFVGRQSGNIYRDNVAVGILGNATCSGFHWPEFSHGIAVFDRGNLSHNTNCTGIFAWQNDDLGHQVNDFTSYHHRWAGIVQGAYLNLYSYTNLTLYGNGESCLELHSMSHMPNPPAAVRQQFVNVYCDFQGAPYGVRTADHALDAEAPTFFTGWTFVGTGTACFAIVTPPAAGRDWLDVDATTTCPGNKYWFNPDVPSGSLVVDRATQQNLRRGDQPGTFNGTWNARTSPCGCGPQPPVSAPRSQTRPGPAPD